MGVLLAGGCVMTGGGKFEAEPFGDRQYSIAFETQGAQLERHSVMLARHARATCNGDFEILNASERIQLCADDCDMVVRTVADLICADMA